MEGHGLIFITGGVRSGKSTFAEKYAQSLAVQTSGSLHYMATSRPDDAEMRERIAAHQRQREISGMNWRTMECPENLAVQAASFESGDIVLLDCLTVLLTNELYREGFSETSWSNMAYQHTVMHSILTGIKAIQDQAAQLFIVSNEVLNEFVLDTEVVKVYSRLIGSIHQQLVKMADEAYLVESGIPVDMKGDGPW